MLLWGKILFGLKMFSTWDSSYEQFMWQTTDDETRVAMTKSQNTNVLKQLLKLTAFYWVLRFRQIWHLLNKKIHNTSSNIIY